MKKYPFLLVFVILLASLGSMAQLSPEQIKVKYETESIFHTGYYRYVKNGETFRTGMFGRKIAGEFQHSPEALTFYKKYRAQQRNSSLLGLAGIAGFIGYHFLLDFENPGNPDNVLAVSSYGAGVLFCGTSIYSGHRAQHNFDKAVWLRNRDLFSEESLRKKFEEKTIYHLNYTRYYKNGSKHKTGFMGDKIRHEMEVSPEAMAAFNIYRKKEKTGYMLFGAGIAALIGSVFIVDFEEPGNPRNFIAGGVYGAGLTMACFSISHFTNAQKQFDKSIWLRNREVMVNL